jgi:hypothetical protein
VVAAGCQLIFAEQTRIGGGLFEPAEDVKSA